MKLENVEDKETSYSDLVGNISIQLTLPYETQPKDFNDYCNSLGIDIRLYVPYKIEISFSEGFAGGKSDSMDNIYIDIFTIIIEEKNNYIEIKEMPVKKFCKYDTLKNFITKIDGFAINLFTDKKYINDYNYPVIDTDEKIW